MAQIHKSECSFVIKAPVAEMHDMWSTKLSFLSTICPDIFHSVDLLEGQMGREGCAFACKFNHLGQTLVVKETMEEVDRENNRIVEGGPLDVYKSFKWTCQASPVDNVVRWTSEYEMDGAAGDVPEPTAYMALLGAVMNRIDAYLTRA